MELAFLSATQLLDGFRRRELSPVEVVDALAARIEAVDPIVGAFTALRLDEARAEAAEAEQAYARGDVRPLAGVPVAIKDLIDTADLPTAYGSSIFRGHRPAEDAPVVRRIREAGGIVLGKTQLHEFAWGLTSVNANGSSRNPWSLDRIPGGSSGGSGVALAAGLAPLAVGTDTGGSIRVPSAFCGVVGLKPTFGRVSTEGVWPLAPSLDHVGPMARTPADARLLFEVLAGARLAPPPRVDGLRAALLPGIDDVRETLTALGLHPVAADLPELAQTLSVYRPIQLAEALLVHTRAGIYPERSAEYGEDLRDRMKLAEATTLEQYVDAAYGRELLRAGFTRLFASVDLAAALVSERGAPPAHSDLTVMRATVLPYTAPANLAGLPSCVVRAGFDPEGLPLGIQLIGPPGREDVVLAVAEAFVDATAPLQARWPELLATRA